MEEETEATEVWGISHFDLRNQSKAVGTQSWNSNLTPSDTQAHGA